MKRILTCLLGLLLLTACRKQQDPTGATSTQSVALYDLGYGPHPQQVMDIYLPAGRGPQTTLVLLLHGGGFVAGDKSEVSAVAQQYLAMGYAVANLNYRLVDSSGLQQEPVLHQASAIKISDQLGDVAAALDMIHTRLAEWQLSADRVVIAGHSAGATLALLYAHGSLNGDRRVKAAANFAGATTFAFSDESEVAQQPPAIIEVLYRATGYEATNEHRLAYMAISPYWVSNNTTNGVPVINVRPGNDGSHDLYEAYAGLLTGKGIVNVYRIIPGAGHGFDPEGKWQEALGAHQAFLQANGL